MSVTISANASATPLVPLMTLSNAVAMESAKSWAISLASCISAFSLASSMRSRALTAASASLRRASFRLSRRRSALAAARSFSRAVSSTASASCRSASISSSNTLTASRVVSVAFSSASCLSITAASPSRRANNSSWSAVTTPAISSACSSSRSCSAWVRTMVSSRASWSSFSTSMRVRCSVLIILRLAAISSRSTLSAMSSFLMFTRPGMSVRWAGNSASTSIAAARSVISVLRSRDSWASRRCSSISFSVDSPWMDASKADRASLESSKRPSAFLSSNVTMRKFSPVNPMTLNSCSHPSAANATSLVSWPSSTIRISSGGSTTSPMEMAVSPSCALKRANTASLVPPHMRNASFVVPSASSILVWMAANSSLCRPAVLSTPIRARTFGTTSPRVSMLSPIPSFIWISAAVRPSSLIVRRSVSTEMPSSSMASRAFTSGLISRLKTLSRPVAACSVLPPSRVNVAMKEPMSSTLEPSALAGPRTLLKAPASELASRFPSRTVAVSTSIARSAVSPSLPNA